MTLTPVSLHVYRNLKFGVEACHPFDDYFNRMLLFFYYSIFKTHNYRDSALSAKSNILFDVFADMYDQLAAELSYSDLNTYILSLLLGVSHYEFASFLKMNL